MSRKYIAASIIGLTLALFGRGTAYAGSTGGLREGKCTTFEGGNRVPAIMKWPWRIPAGRVCGKMAVSIDILPTIAAISGGSLPERVIDGVNILPLMEGETQANSRREFYYYYGNRLEALRKDDGKLILPHSHRTL